MIDSHLKPWRSILLWSIALFVALQLPSIRVIVKFLPASLYWLLPLYWLGCGMVYYSIVRSTCMAGSAVKKTMVRVLASKYTWFGLLLLLFMANYYLYPLADALKFQNRGSDQDDAIIAVAKALFSGHSPYNVLTYRHNVPSPGPGLVLLLSPFVLTHTYFAATPFVLLLLTAIIIWQKGSFKQANLFLLLLVSSPFFWELMINGSDLIIIGSLFALLYLLIRLQWTGSKQLLLLAFMALALTSRVVFLYLAPVYIFIAGISKKTGLKQIVRETMTLMLGVVALHALFFSFDTNHYAPIHFFAKWPNMLIFATITSIIAIVFTVKYVVQLQRFFVGKEIYLLLFSVAIPMLLITVVALWQRHFNMLSYPVSYLMVAVPLIILAYSYHCFDKT